MKFRVISDVHLDFSTYNLPSLETDKETTLLVCGDIGTGDRVFRTVEWLVDLADRFLSVCFCLGNHDYWYNSVEGVGFEFRSYLRTFGRSNLHFLDNSRVDIGEFIIFGGTMWTDVPPYAEIYEKNMGDWHYIEQNDQGFKFGASQQVEEHKKYKETLQHLLNTTSKDVIVMSHHAPVCTRDHFPHRNNLDVYYFCSDMVDLVGHERVKMWCHGHTHDAVDTVCMDTNIVCNPRGYEGEHHTERTGYDSEKIWEEEMKLCKDCKWFEEEKFHYDERIPSWYYTTPMKCNHPNNKKVCLVTGESNFKKSPHDLRSFSVLAFETDGCGKEGIWWEPK